MPSKLLLRCTWGCGKCFPQPHFFGLIQLAGQFSVDCETPSLPHRGLLPNETLTDAMNKAQFM